MEHPPEGAIRPFNPVHLFTGIMLGDVALTLDDQTVSLYGHDDVIFVQPREFGLDNEVVSGLKYINCGIPCAGRFVENVRRLSGTVE